MIWIKITPANNSFNLGRIIPRLGDGVPEVISPMWSAYYPNMVLDCWDNTWVVSRSSLIAMNTEISNRASTNAPWLPSWCFSEDKSFLWYSVETKQKKKKVLWLTCQSLMKILRSQVQPHNAWMLFILNVANLARWGRVTRLGRFISILSRNFLWAVEVCQKIQCNWWEQVGLSRSTLAAFIHTLPLQGTECMGRRLIRKTFLQRCSAPSVFLHPSIRVIIPVSWDM